MFTSGELERVSMALDAPMRQMEMRIMSDIVRRIKESGELTSTADWQINRLVQNGVSMEEVRTAVSDALGCSDAEVTEIFTAAVREGYVRDRRLYEQSGNVFVPFEENAELQQLLGAVTVQTNTTLRNITQSLGFARRGADGHIHFIPLAGYYQQTLDSAVLDIASGAFDYDTVLKRAVREMTDSGLRTVDYATGWSNRVDVAARRAIMTGMNQLTAQMNEANAEKLGTDWFEVSWHSGARPSHWWGGRWFTRKQLETVCGLGDVTGLCGANCYHGYSPVIPGISVPTYSDEELAEMNRRENEPVEWNGRKYTRYEALQRQRRLETTMRAQRQEMQLLKEGGASEDDLINCRARYRTTSDEYARFSQAAGLPQQRERVTADGLGNIMQGRYNGGSGKPSPVKVPPVGAEVNDRVTSAERTELLSRNPVDIHNSSIDNSGGSGIIELGSEAMYRKPKPDKIEPMPRKQFRTIVKAFKRNGGLIQFDDETEEYLDSKNAEAITYNENTILIRQSPGRASVFEELIHTEQYRNGRNDGSYKSRLQCEIEAQKKLIKNSKAYKLTEREVFQTQKALEAYENELREYYKNGGV